MRTIAMVITVSAALLAAGGCGGSSAADKAKTQACNAVSDIQSQITALKGLPLATSSVDQAKTALQKIDADLHTISSAAPKVTGDLKDNLKSANSTFKAQVDGIASSITSAQSLTDAAAALTTAGTTLQSSYEQAFADVGC